LDLGTISTKQNKGVGVKKGKKGREEKRPLKD